MKRQFKGLRNRPPNATYDATIIGAGIGGLFCANLLAQAGLRVLLVEQHYMVGGYCSTFRRSGYTFDAATHFYPLLGNSETLTGRILNDLGVETKWVKMDPVDTFHFPDGTKFDVPAHFQEYIAALKEDFPQEHKNLENFFSVVREAYMHGLLYYFRGCETPQLLEYRDMTVRYALDKYFQHPKLKLLLTADCPHWGSPPCRTSFVFDSMLRLSYFLGNYYPVGGSQKFADALASNFENYGGHILMSSRATQILATNQKATGVVCTTLRGSLRGRHEIRSGMVVSNVDLRQTVERLLGPNVVSPEYIDKVSRLRPSYPCFLVHLGLKGVSSELLEAVQGYYWDSWDPDLVGTSGLCCKVFAPTLYEPSLAPSGGHIVILQKVLDMAYNGVDDWEEHKTKIEAFMVGHLESVIPDLKNKIVVKTSASAKTSFRFTGNTAGAMLGWEMSPSQLGRARPGIRGPLSNLYFTGHWTQPGGGITPVIVSAKNVAQAIISDSGCG